MHLVETMRGHMSRINRSKAHSFSPDQSAINLSNHGHFMSPRRHNGPCSANMASIRAYSEELRNKTTEISEVDYHKLADHTLEDLLERIEAYVEDIGVDGDVEYSQGVLTIKLGELGTFVLNKQTPNKQIWLSSPISGPFRYDYHAGTWVYARDGHRLHDKLQNELAQLTGGNLDLNPCSTCDRLNACHNGTYCLK